MQSELEKKVEHERYKKRAKELEKYVDRLVIGACDGSTASAVNVEHRFKPDDIFLTDGCVMSGMTRCFREEDESMTGGIEVETAIRGGTYLVVSNFREDTIVAYVDREYLVEKEDAIHDAIERIGVNSDDIEYYSKNWRSATLDNPTYDVKPVD